MAAVSSVPITLQVGDLTMVPAGSVEVDVDAAPAKPELSDGVLHLVASPRVVLDRAFVRWVNAQQVAAEGAGQ